MQLNLNNKNKKILKLVIKEKYFKKKTGLESKMFDRLIVNEFTKQCGDSYYYSGTPVSINIECRINSKISSAEKQNQYITNLPNLNNLTSAVCKSLVGVAFDSENQVSEMFATKIFGNENRIVIEIEML